MSEMHVYNTLSRQREEFIPLEEDTVNIYVCGPTTYNYIHLGNARPLVVFDTIRRYLEYKGFAVNYIQNFTDVDDKIINRAKEENREPLALAADYIEEYFRDADSLNVRRATVHPKVSENIPEIINFVSELVANEKAYVVDGDVYFSVRSFDDYGKLSGRSLDDLRAGARVEINERKKDPLDFVLWKSDTESDISWDSPWGKGRPGWHIECSAMSKKHLGKSFDIHGGGHDLIFPHHENEIAQSESVSGSPMAKYWLHNGFITINQEKMSKSLGNFFLVREILEKFAPQVVRFYLISTHYRSPLDFDDEKLEVARRGLERIQNSYRMLQNAKARAGEQNAAPEEMLRTAIEEAERAYRKAMDDDFNTALAIASVFDLTREINTYLREENYDLIVLREAEKTLVELMDILGIEIDKEIVAEDELTEKIGKAWQAVAEHIKKTGLETAQFSAVQPTTAPELMDDLLRLREESRAAKNFALADLIRDSLKENSVVLEDTPQGTSWKYEPVN